jgi:hypothetical protein
MVKNMRQSKESVVHEEEGEESEEGELEPANKRPKSDET